MAVSVIDIMVLPPFTVIRVFHKTSEFKTLASSIHLEYNFMISQILAASDSPDNYINRLGWIAKVS